MIICDYIDNNVNEYLKNNSGNNILTFFKEPFKQCGDSQVFFIDDILNESDHQNIDKFVDRTIMITEEVFSKYLKINEYNLFDYLKVQAERDFAKLYKYKYAVDKLSNDRLDNYIVYFSSEINLFVWLKQDYVVKRIISNPCLQSKTQIDRIKLRFKTWINTSRFVGYFVDKRFEDQKSMSNCIIWLASDRFLHSKLLDELQKEFNILLLQNTVITYSSLFAKKGIKYRLLKLHNCKHFIKERKYVNQQYAKGLIKTAYLVGLRPQLLEIVLNINRNMIEELLTTLLILQDNDHNSSFLFVSQTMKGIQALGVDYFNRNNLPSIEMIHGVPSSAEVGKTTKILVYGQRDISFFKKHGVDESKLFITGCPSYDKLFNIQEQDKSFDFLLLILDWIGFIPSANSQRIIFEEVMHMLKLVQYFEREQLIIKLHPSQTQKEIEYINNLANIAGISTRVKVIKDIDITDLLKKAKIVYTYESSVGLEALLIGKPVIILPRLASSEVEYGIYNGCLTPSNGKELLISTENILRDIQRYLKNNKDNIERTIKYFSGDTSGESYKRVVNFFRDVSRTLR